MRRRNRFAVVDVLSQDCFLRSLGYCASIAARGAMQRTVCVVKSVVLPQKSVTCIELHAQRKEECALILQNKEFRRITSLSKAQKQYITQTFVAKLDFLQHSTFYNTANKFKPAP